MNKRYLSTTALLGSLLLGAVAGQARAQEAGAAAAGDADFGEIIVTAQKREEKLSNVGMSIAAATGDQLATLGVNEPADLSKIVSGFTFAQSPYNTPIYTLRGVGFYESTLSASPTVSVYVDEVPLPYPALTTAAGLDPQRVEVLKGPQGTLFGQNSTGGAINYIAAKPTADFRAGTSVSYARFNEVDANFYVSGPITDTLRGRIAVSTSQGGAWQRNILNGETLGDKNLVQGRILLDWTPTDRLKLALNLTGWKDNSDTQTPQLIARQLQTPGQPGGSTDIVNAQPLIPDGHARLAAWGRTFPLTRDDSMLQGSLRADYELTDTLTVTSLTSYIRYRSLAGMDVDGMAIRNLDTEATGEIDSFFQELRLSGNTPKLHWIVGANYQKDNTHDSLIYDAGQSSNVIGWNRDINFSNQDMKTFAVFANADYQITDSLSVLAGVRYTNAKRDYNGCSLGDAGLAAIYNYVAQVFHPGAPSIDAGECVTLNVDYSPAGLIYNKLNEDNVSWRVGLNYKVTPDALLYANVSRGFKAGSFPTLAASQTPQTLPVVQEDLIAYEGGFKAKLARGVNVDGAVFYYDYTNKQVRGKIVDFLFGVEERLVNLPKSHVFGVELQATVQPVSGLRLTANGTYLETKIDRYSGLDSAGLPRNYRGTPFPASPKWQGFADAEYEFAVSAKANAFFGGNVTYNSATNNSLDQDARAAIKEFTTVDLRAGLRSADDAWTVMVFGRNVTNAYYWNNVYKANDTWVRYAAKPATYGIKLQYSY
ncbi:TonB-dependent receptor [Novosphingobium sp. KCTC 2891]|uniref:TonB-dependent receptor n=1 Tax=Novosphingobium sp. KCTC 2891 TaxID=2989730 RepID=UPI002223D260|nr:TonB-dependent receptor [Novosphingobium sp. KCTC 2891]MCW1383702.1 TonB-dependent receptor [Novosphingobium sp. KCTC 2891]